MQDKHFEIWYFTTAAGVNPVRDYINGKDDKARQKIRSVINLLQARGHELAWPFVKHLRGRIRELIIEYAGNEHRILFAWYSGRIVFLHAFDKKRQATKNREIETAEARLRAIEEYKK